MAYNLVYHLDLEKKSLTVKLKIKHLLYTFDKRFYRKKMYGFN